MRRDSWARGSVARSNSDTNELIDFSTPEPPSALIDQRRKACFAGSGAECGVEKIEAVVDYADDDAGTIEIRLAEEADWTHVDDPDPPRPWIEECAGAE